MSADITLSAPDARTLTDRIKTGAAVLWDLLKQAYVGDAWRVLGYESWDSYCTSEFGTSRIVMPREERAVEIPSMRELGMPIRAIASATNLGIGTVHRALAPVPNGTPATRAEVKGLDGKTYPASQPERPRATAMPQDDLDALNTPTTEPVDEDPEPPTWEPAGQMTPAAVQAITPEKPKRRPLTDEVWSIVLDLKKTLRHLERTTTDDRFAQKKAQIAELASTDLSLIEKTIADYRDNLTH